MIRIREWMTSPIISIKPRDTILHAREIMEKNRINQLPVVVRNRLVGIVTDRDLRDAFPSVLNIAGRRRRGRRRPSAGPGEVCIEDVMARNVLTVAPDGTIDHAAQLIRRERIGAVPVIEKGKIIGILTRSDLLDACASLVEELRVRGLESSRLPANASDEIRVNW
jgi:acetoin utilization protein AcuB